MAQNSLFVWGKRIQKVWGGQKKCQLIDSSWRGGNVHTQKEIKEVEIWLSFSNCQPWNFKHFPKKSSKKVRNCNSTDVFYFHIVGDLGPYALGLGQIFPLIWQESGWSIFWGWNGQSIYGSINWLRLFFSHSNFLLHRSKGATVGGSWMAWNWRNTHEVYKRQV